MRGGSIVTNGVPKVALDDFFYIPLDVNLEHADADIRHGIRQLGIELKSLTNHDFYIAGAPLLLDLCSNTLRAGGVPSEQLNLDTLLHH